MPPRSPWTRRQLLGAAALVLTGVVAVAALRFGQNRRHPAVAIQQVAVPSYFAPGDEWVRLAAGAPTAALAIVNPSSGPGTEPWPELAASAATAQAAGVAVVGYVDTDFARRDPSLVLDDIARYYQWYGVDGVFFDQMRADCGALDYYVALAADVEARGGRAVLNPGTNPDKCYADVGDVLVVFEGTTDDYAHWKPASWQWKLPPQRFWHLVYGVGPDRQADVLETARHRNAGWVYVTPDGLPNPWGRLPPGEQWAGLLATAAAGGDPAGD